MTSGLGPYVDIDIYIIYYLLRVSALIILDFCLHRFISLHTVTRSRPSEMHRKGPGVLLEG